MFTWKINSWRKRESFIDSLVLEFTRIRTVAHYISKMAVCSQIATGVFLISWTNPDYGLTGQFDVAITEVQQFCTIQTYKIVHRKVTFLLTTSTMRNSTVADQVWQVKSVKLIRRGVQHPMQYQNSKWIATLDVKSMDWKARFDIVIDFNCQNMLMVKKESKMVVDRMLHLWLTKDYADITFDVGQKKIKAHRLVIINSGCPALADLFKDDYQLVVSIHGVQPDVFDKLLRFIYTGDADIERSTVWDLFMAGRKYGLDSLIEQCAVYISRNLSVENSTEYLLGSYQHNFSSLYRYTLDFMSKNGKAITSRPEWTEIKQRYPEVCITAMQAMITG